ncbi:MAG TPA: DUF5658 family protein [Coriobacteriia bacterium]
MGAETVVGGRSAERRARRRFVMRERRSGFERRGAAGRVPLLQELRDRPAALAVLLIAVNVMNLLDQLATTRALAAGASEGNPVMAGLIAADPRLAAVVKLAVIAGVSAGVWSLRRYRAILQVGVFVFLVFAAVLLLHYAGSAFFY